MGKFSRCLFLALCASSLTWAAPVGNPATPRLLCKGLFIPQKSWMNVRAGYEGDFITDGKLKQQMEGSGRVDDYDISTNSATLTLNILSRLDLYGVFGASKTSAQWRFINALDVVHHVEMDTEHRFLWGIGTRCLLVRWDALDLGLGARFSRCQSHPAKLTIDGMGSSLAHVRADWKEWQVNLGASYHVKILTPYIGVKYSKALAHVGRLSVPISASGSGSNHFKNKYPVGLYLGCSLSTGKYVLLNIEGRLIDEEALTVSGDIRF